MLIPEWLLWLVFIATIFFMVKYFMRGEFDFVTPIIGIAVFFIAIALRFGFYLGS